MDNLMLLYILSGLAFGLLITLDARQRAVPLWQLPVLFVGGVAFGIVFLLIWLVIRPARATQPK